MIYKLANIKKPLGKSVSEALILESVIPQYDGTYTHYVL